MGNSEKKKRKNLRPSKFVCVFFYIVSSLLLFFQGYRVKVDRSVFKKYKKGFILINNHYTNMDEFVLAKGTFGRRINYVVSSHFFYQKKTAVFLRLIKAISKEQFLVDTKAIRQALSVLKQDGIIYIAPAGQVSLVGANNYIPESIVKLVKLANVDVLCMREYGTHYTLPKWSRTKTNKRRYPIKIEFDKVLGKDEINTLTDEEIYSKITSSIDVNDYLINEEKKIKIKGRNIIEGLEGALFTCPKCLKMGTLVTLGNEMECENCHNKVFMDEYGFLNPSSDEDKCFRYPYDWYHFQKLEIKKQILNNELDLNDEYYVRVYDKEKKNMVTVGAGKLVMRRDYFAYEGEFEGKDTVIEYDLDKLLLLPYSCHSHLEIPDKDRFYQFKPVNERTEPIRYAIVVEVMTDMKNNRI